MKSAESVRNEIDEACCFRTLEYQDIIIKQLGKDASHHACQTMLIVRADWPKAERLYITALNNGIPLYYRGLSQADIIS